MAMSMKLEQSMKKEINNFLLLIVISIVVITLSILIGSTQIAFDDLLKFISGKQVENYVINIIKYVRIPRTLAGYLCGFALAFSGILLQTSLNNALASPSTIGVNAGAGLFVVISAIIFPYNLPAKFILAFLGAIIISLIVYYTSVFTGTSKMTIILAGIAISTFCNAISDAIITVSPDVVFDRSAFYIGSLSTVKYDQLIVSTIFIIIAFIVIMFFTAQIDILKLGNELPKTLGINVKTLHLIILLSASLMAGASIAIAGLLGFIGLIIPQIALRIFNSESKTLLPKAGLLGGIFLVTCDLLTRIVFAPYELPVGIVLSFIGAPFFIYLLFSGKKRGDLYS